MEKLNLTERISDENTHKLILEPRNASQEKLKEFFTEYGINDYSLTNDGNYEIIIDSEENIKKLASVAQCEEIDGYHTVRAILYPENFPNELNQYPINEEKELITEKDLEETMYIPTMEESIIKQPSKKGANITLAAYITGVALVGGFGVYNSVNISNLEKENINLQNKLSQLKQTTELTQGIISELDTKYSKEINGINYRITTQEEDLQNSIKRQAVSFKGKVNTLTNKLTNHKNATNNNFNEFTNKTEQELLMVANEVERYQNNFSSSDNVIKNSVNNLDQKLENTEEILNKKIEELDEKKGTSLWYRIKNIF